MGFSKSSSSSSNQAYPFLQGALGSSVGNVGTASDALSALLGGDSTGLNAFKNATGFTQQLKSGLSDAALPAAASGLLRSGSTAKSLASYGNMLENQSARNYIQNLLGFGQLGLGAASVIGGAGQTSKSSSKGLQGPASLRFGG